MIMVKVKKLLSFFTAALVAASLALSSGVASALSAEQIKTKIQNLSVTYTDGSVVQIKNRPDWLELFSDVLEYADATDADVTAQGDFSTQNWADWLMHPNGFKADPNNEEANLRAILTNFGHNDGYWQSGWRINNDFNLLTDWGAIYFTVQNRDGNEKNFKDYCYDNAKFLHKIREIYNLDPAASAKQYDALCLRAILRAMVEYNKSLGIETEPSLDSFVDEILKTEFFYQLVLLITNNAAWKATLGTDDNFSLQDRNLRSNAFKVYEKIAIILIASYYNSVGKTEHKDYEIIFNKDDGYVASIKPIGSSQTGSSEPSSVLVTLTQQDKKDQANGTGSTSSTGSTGGGGGYTIKGTGSGIDHFAAAVVTLAIGISGIAGLGYVVSRKNRKNAE